MTDPVDMNRGNEQQMVLHNFSGKTKRHPRVLDQVKETVQDACVGGQHRSSWSSKSGSSPPNLFLSCECIAKDFLKPLEQ